MKIKKNIPPCWNFETGKWVWTHCPTADAGGWDVDEVGGKELWGWVP